MSGQSLYEGYSTLRGAKIALAAYMKQHEEFIKKPLYKDGFWDEDVIGIVPMNGNKEITSEEGVITTPPQFNIRITEFSHMVETDVLQKLFRAFPNSIINHSLEFVADVNPRVNSYFRLSDCDSEEDVQAKVLEWLSRDAYKSTHYRTNKKNEEVHKYHLNGINSFLGTEFTPEDVAVIYQELGNCINHKKTLEFIRSGYKMALIKYPIFASMEMQENDRSI